MAELSRTSGSCGAEELETAEPVTQPVRDFLASIEKLRKDAAEAAAIRDLATDSTKREMFDRLHLHLNRLADEVERAMRAGALEPTHWKILHDKLPMDACTVISGGVYPDGRCNLHPAVPMRRIDGG